MNNVVLEYLLKNNPDEVLSKNGVKIRKFISPLFRKVMMLFTSGKLVIVRKGIVPREQKIIYAATHGFHDDIIFSMKTAGRHTYLLYGSLMDFYKSFHGLGLWINGVTIVDRKNKQSRNAAIDKMARVSEYGANNIMFPEGTWNKTESKLVQKLYPGIFDVAEKTGDLVVPIATVLYGKICYSIEGDAYDITNIDEKMSLEIIRQQIIKLEKTRDLFIYNTNDEFYIKNVLTDLLELLSGNSTVVQNYINSVYFENFNQINNIVCSVSLESLDNNTRLKLIDMISDVMNIVLSKIDEVKKNYNVEENSICGSILNRSKEIIKSASKQKKITAVAGLRDKMCTLAWELYKKGDRAEFYPGYWEDYIKGLIETTNGLYDYTIEDVAEYKDVEDITLSDVYSILDNVELTKQNAQVLVASNKQRSHHL